MSNSGNPNEPVGPAGRGRGAFDNDGTLQGIIALWNSTNQLLVQIFQAIAKITYILPGTYTVATLPATGVAEGTRTQVSDSNSTTFNAAVAGGGANHIGVIYLNGAWRIG